MSLDITFEKQFTIEDVENKTSLNIEYKDNNWWLYKNNSFILIKCYTHSETDIKNMILDGFEILKDGEKTYAIKNDEKELIIYDKGKKNIIDSLTRYGMNDISLILDEIVLTFQTKFITDNEEEMIYRDETLSIDNLYNNVMLKYGYKINNGIISK